MTTLWDAAIARAEALAASSPAPLAFVAALLRVQRRIYTRVQTATVPHTAASGLSGDLAIDLPLLRSSWPSVIDVAATQGPEPLARDANELRLADPKMIDAMLIGYWRAPATNATNAPNAPARESLIAKALLQPYARALADVRIKPADRDRIQPDQRCPFCGGLPQLAVLTAIEPDATTPAATATAIAPANATATTERRRQLQCATCLTVWPLQRALCPSCGEQDERRLGYFHAADSAYPHVRVEVCATCEHYLKAVDLTTDPAAIPLVDEIAASGLDTWARDQGLKKIEHNLAGL